MDAPGALRRGPRGLSFGTTLVLLVGVAALINLLHFLTPASAVVLHELFQRLSYVPIVLAAFWLGVRGGLACSLTVSLIYAPHVFLHATHFHIYLVSQWAEIAVYNMVGILVGALSDAQMRERRNREMAHAELERAYRELSDAGQRLREADRLAALGMISAGLAHEVRNPLTAMKGALEIVGRRISGDDPAREFVGILEQQVGRLEALVTSFLLYARPPSPALLRQPAAEIAEGVVRLLSPEAAAGGVELRLDAAAELPPVLVDAALLQQALVNVVRNALHASGGTVTLDVAAAAPWVAITVRDAGPGILPEDAPRVFEPFYTRREGGTGLGLAIAARSMAEQGGKLELLESRPGRTAFRFLLPAAP